MRNLKFAPWPGFGKGFCFIFQWYPGHRARSHLEKGLIIWICTDQRLETPHISISRTPQTFWGPGSVSCCLANQTGSIQWLWHKPGESITMWGMGVMTQGKQRVPPSRSRDGGAYCLEQGHVDSCMWFQAGAYVVPANPLPVLHMGICH
jgi:hypothetical protein